MLTSDVYPAVCCITYTLQSTGFFTQSRDFWNEAPRLLVGAAIQRLAVRHVSLGEPTLLFYGLDVHNCMMSILLDDAICSGVTETHVDLAEF